VFKCTKVLEAMMIKRVEELTPANHTPSPWTLDDFLKSKKPKILDGITRKEIRNKLFPAGDFKTNLSHWDVSMICQVLSFLFDKTSPTMLDINCLKSIRNNICHSLDAVLDMESYEHYRAVIMGVLERLFTYTDDKELEQTVRSSLKDINDGSSFTLSETEVRRCIYLWYTSERAIEQKLDSLCEGTSLYYYICTYEPYRMAIVR